jgi:hypothetical protein
MYNIFKHKPHLTTPPKAIKTCFLLKKTQATSPPNTPTPTVEPCSTAALFTNVNNSVFFLILKNSASELIHSHCSHEKFSFFLKKKISAIN